MTDETKNKAIKILKGIKILTTGKFTVVIRKNDYAKIKRVCDLLDNANKQLQFAFMQKE